MGIERICSFPIIWESGVCGEPSAEVVEHKIKELELALGRFPNVLILINPGYENVMRVELAELYVQTGRNQEAIVVLETALASPCNAFINCCAPIPSIPFIPGYFEILLGLAEAYKSVDPEKSNEYCDRVMRELSDGQILAAQAVRPLAVAGLRSRALAIKAGK